MDKTEILALESRRRIYERVKKQPGTHLREVARGLDLPLGTVLYHLDYLESNDLVVVRRDGRYKRYFVKHMLGRREKEYVSAFHHNVPRKITLVLLAKGAKTQRELCEEIGVSRSTLSFHVNNLTQKQILHCEERWPENLYTVDDPDVAANILVTHGETFRAGLAERFQRLLDGITRRFTEEGRLKPLAVGAPDGAPNARATNVPPVYGV